MTKSDAIKAISEATHIYVNVKINNFTVRVVEISPLEALAVMCTIADSEQINFYCVENVVFLGI
jgi:hypothetical protein